VSPLPVLPPNQRADLGEGEQKLWMKQEMRNSDWSQSQRLIVAYLDSLPLIGDLRSERVNELPVPAFVARAAVAG
jgi:hypothetical protein